MQVLPPMGFIKFNNQTDTYNVVLMPYFLTRRKWHTICTNSIHLSVSKLKNTFSRPVRVVWLKSTHVLRTFKATTAAPEIRVCGEFVLLHRTVDTPQFEREKQISTWLDGRDKRGVRMTGGSRCDCWEIPRWKTKLKLKKFPQRTRSKAQRDHLKITDKHNITSFFLIKSLNQAIK